MLGCTQPTQNTTFENSYAAQEQVTKMQTQIISLYVQNQGNCRLIAELRSENCQENCQFEGKIEKLINTLNVANSDMDDQSKDNAYADFLNTYQTTVLEPCLKRCKDRETSDINICNSFHIVNQ
jgi:hypothetical protein